MISAVEEIAGDLGLDIFGTGGSVYGIEMTVVPIGAHVQRASTQVFGKSACHAVEDFGVRQFARRRFCAGEDVRLLPRPNASALELLLHIPEERAGIPGIYLFQCEIFGPMDLLGRPRRFTAETENLRMMSRSRSTDGVALEYSIASSNSSPDTARPSLSRVQFARPDPPGKPAFRTEYLTWCPHKNCCEEQYVSMIFRQPERVSGQTLMGVFPTDSVPYHPSGRFKYRM